jgi:hypothetical protein
MSRLLLILSLALSPVIACGASPGDNTPADPAVSSTDVAPAPSDSIAAVDAFLPASATLDLAGQQPPDSRDWAGMRKDTGYFLGYQFAVIGVLYVMPESISGWTQEQKDSFSVQKWKDNIRHVVWDKDEWYINYILHPYWGATYYVRAQQRGFGPVGSFWYSAMLSTMYEFGAEALFEKPSIQDMIFTPVGGAIVGDYFMTLRGEIQARGATSGMDRFLLIVTDPLGALNNKVDGWLGKDASVTLQPVFGPMVVPTAAAGDSDALPSYSLSAPMLGVKTTLRW